MRVAGTLCSRTSPGSFALMVFMAPLQVVGDDTTVMDSVLACDVERLELLKVRSAAECAYISTVTRCDLLGLP